jgi:hypothetical protein
MPISRSSFFMKVLILSELFFSCYLTPHSLLPAPFGQEWRRHLNSLSSFFVGGCGTFQRDNVWCTNDHISIDNQNQYYAQLCPQSQSAIFSIWNFKHHLHQILRKSALPSDFRVLHSYDPFCSRKTLQIAMLSVSVRCLSYDRIWTVIRKVKITFTKNVTDFERRL